MHTPVLQVVECSKSLHCHARRETERPSSDNRFKDCSIEISENPQNVCFCRSAEAISSYTVFASQDHQKKKGGELAVNTFPGVCELLSFVTAHVLLRLGNVHPSWPGMPRYPSTPRNDFISAHSWSFHHLGVAFVSV